MFDNARFYILSTALGYETSYGPHDLIDEDIPMSFIVRECAASIYYDSEDDCFKIDTYTYIVFDNKQFDTHHFTGRDVSDRVYDKKTEYDMIKRMIGYTEQLLHKFYYPIHEGKFTNIYSIRTGLRCAGVGNIRDIAPSLIINPRQYEEE